MAVSTVKLNGTTLMTVNDTTATAADVTSGEYFYAADGTKTLGTASGGSATIEPLSVTANGTYTAPSGVDGYSPVTVNVSSGGGDSSSSTYENKVYFYDYDGTLLYSYTPEQASALAALPSNPSHTGLTAQGWNWTLAEIQDYLEDYPTADINVGQNYVTSDGKTRIYLHFEDATRLSPYLALAPNGTVTIDWGDNSSTDTLTGTGLTAVKRIQHTYLSTGDYILTLTATSGSFSFYSTGNVPSFLHATTGTTTTDGSKARMYLNTVRKIEMGTNATIGAYAFYNCYSLESITISNSNTTIGTQAFSYCYSLKCVILPYNTTTISSNFDSCGELENVSIPNTVTGTLGSTSIFNYCYSLKSITIPSEVTTIPMYFCRNSKIESIVIPSKVTTINQYAFANNFRLKSIIIPNNVTSIGAQAFSGCSSLTHATLSNNITTISDTIFSGCSALRSIVIPDNVTSIGGNVFNGCRDIESIIIPDNVTSIGNYAFGYCASLKSITIPNTVTTFGSNAFSSCYTLKSVIIPDGTTSLPNNIFQNCYSLESVTIPSTVTTIGNYAFSNCYSLNMLTFPTNLGTLGTYVCQNCYSLQKIIIPDGITSIGTYAFQNCYSLASITIPSGVTSIGAYAFNSCYGMKEYHFLPTAPPTLASTNAFSNIPSDCVIYVPQGSLEAYQTSTNWSSYSSYMREEPT